MAINFPTSLDTLTNPSASDFLNSPSHSGQHSNANDILEALEAKVGIDSSAVTTSHDYLLRHLPAQVQIATPSNPAAGSNKLYFKSDDKLYRLTSGGSEAQVGGSGDFLVTQIFS